MDKRIRALVELEEAITHCRKCPRLVAYREQVAVTKRRAYMEETYWGRPVPGFGDPDARLLVLGLAPGAHGSNRTGRMFTGDGSGNFLFPSLYRTGFASQEFATSREDGMVLRDLFITAVCRCVPPANKPLPEEIRNCQPWLEAELNLLEKVQGIIFLGKIALDGWLGLPREKALRKKDFPFKHGAFYEPGEGMPWMLCSYHPSLQNTQTGLLSPAMFDAIWESAKARLV